MKQSKYIIVEKMGLEIPIIFNPILKHADVGRNFIVVSAGFCYLRDDDTYSVYGDSESLKLKSRECDSEILTKYIQFDT